MGRVEETIHLLVADDERAVLDMYRLFLTPSPPAPPGVDWARALATRLYPREKSTEEMPAYELELCQQGEAAVEAVRRAQEQGQGFCAALLDMRMPPGLNGVETAERIRQLDPDINIVIVTGYSDVSPREIAARVPPADKLLYLQKPLHLHEVQHLVRALSAKWRVERALRDTNRRLGVLIEERVAQLRESEERYRTFVTQFQGIAFRARLDLSPVFVHGAVDVITGYAPDAFLAHPPDWRALVHPGDFRRFVRWLRQLRRMPGLSGQEEFRIRRCDGALRWLHAVVQHVPGSGKEPGYLQGTLHDITAQREMREQMIQSQHLAEIGEMSASIAHEIRNPMAGISGAVQVLRAKTPPDAPERDVIEEILAQVTRIDRAVESLLSFAKPWRAEKRRVRLDALIQDVVSAARERKTFHGVVFHLMGPEDCIADLDPALMEQVLWNLFNNAAQAMPEGGDITCSWQELADGVRVTVQDTGPGIPADAMEKLFNPFYTTRTSGTGLGLPICRRIVEAHGGSIEVMTEPGAGAVVKLLIPRS